MTLCVLQGVLTVGTMRNIHSTAIEHGRNADRGAYRDNRSIRCARCGFPCNAERDQERPEEHLGGWGKTDTAQTVTGAVVLTGNLVPVLGDYATPDGSVASASSEYSDGKKPAWKAFNKTQASGTDDAWLSSAACPQWLQYKFSLEGVIPIVTKYTITSRNNAGAARAPSDWTFLGSNDGSTWTTLDTQTDQFVGDTANLKSTYSFTNTTAYQYYRINITACRNTGSNVAIGEMELISDYTVTRTIYDPIVSSGCPHCGTLRYKNG